MAESRGLRTGQTRNRVARLKRVYGYWLPPGMSAERLMEDCDELLRSEDADTERSHPRPSDAD